ncbi:hypothetical protein TNCV_1740631 [Trichonephila clavipes]|uniref:Uncharacterized protein n=1 Tax=Trichonephila clavipes TaxID=2585209 RepID=A0A8X6UY50_TRICX|nr:hypothetical protein TNCV_1740631 [Trichonephila clavipes]
MDDMSHTDAHGTSTRCHSSSTVVMAYGDEPVARKPCTGRFLLVRDRRNLFRIKGDSYNTGNMRSCIILLKRRVSYVLKKGYSHGS